MFSMALNATNPAQLSVHRHGTCGAVWRLDVGDAGVPQAAWCVERASRIRGGRAVRRASPEEVGHAFDRLRRLPDWVHFSPREDAFCASADLGRRAEVLAMMRSLLGRGVDLAFTTRAGLRDARDLVALAEAAPGRLAVRIGVMTRDTGVEARWEAGLAPAGQRIALAGALAEAGAAVALELGPIIPFVNDGARGVGEIMRAAARVGVRLVAPRWIEDGPGLCEQVERQAGRSAGRMLNGWFQQPGSLRDDGRRMLSLDTRSVRRQQLHEQAREHGVTLVECRCMHHGAATACPIAPSRLSRSQLDLGLGA